MQPPVRNIWNNCLPQIIAPFWCENKNNHPWILFKEIWWPTFIQYVNCLLIAFVFSQGCELTDITCLQEYIHLQTVILSHNSLTGEWILIMKVLFHLYFFVLVLFFFIYLKLNCLRSVNRSLCTNRFKSTGLYALSGDTWRLTQWTHHCFRL